MDDYNFEPFEPPPDPRLLNRPIHGGPRYDKIGGWLSLLAVGLTLFVVRIGIDLATTDLPLIGDPKFAAMNDPASPMYQPGLQPLILFEAAGNVLLGVLAVGLLVLMFRRSRLFPRAAMAFYALNLLFSLVDVGWASGIPALAVQPNNGQARQLLLAVVGGVVWSLFLVRSERARQTFVN